MTERCGFTWVPENQNNIGSCAYCCYRDTWKEFDRCVWHAKTDLRKPPDALNESREQPENRKLNKYPRELLSGAVLRNTELSNYMLTGVDLSGSDLQNTDFTDVYLSYSTLSGSDLREADLTDCTVSKTSFKKAKLKGANLRGLSIFGVDFTGADLSRADFQGANIKETNFTGANTEEVKGLVDSEGQNNDEITVEVPEQTQSDPTGETPHFKRKWNSDLLAKTTTLGVEDINNSVSRLTDAGYSREEAVGYVRWYLTEMLQEDGLFAVTGIGPSSGASLVEAGVDTIDQLQSVTPEELSNSTDLSIKKIQKIKKAAEKGKFSSLEPDDDQVAKQLLDSHKNHPTQSTESKHSLDTRKRADKDPSQSENSKAGSTAASQDNTKKARSSSGNDQQNVLSPRELPIPDPEEHTVPGSGTVYPNYLSEYYESFCDSRKVLEIIFQAQGNDIDPENRKDPRVQYFVLLDALIGFSDASTLFTGYGPQHQDRLSFSIADYRKTFGSAETITDYQVIDVNRFREETHELLREVASVKTTREFVRPCLPGTSHSIPELPGSFAELQDALRQLATFPAYPPLPPENRTNNRNIPIADIYLTCFKDLSQEHRVDLSPIEGVNSQPTGPVPAATPTSSAEFESKLVDYNKLSHIFRRIKPPIESPVNQMVNILALDWYRQSSPTFDAVQDLAKHGKDDPMDVFRPRLRDLIHRRFLLDTWSYDYITVYPGHEAGSRSSQLVELAQDSVLETDIIYTPLLERTESVEPQREKSEKKRRQVASQPSNSLRTRAKLNDDTIILFDDICTTGSSLLAGAHLLRQAGADRVVCITLSLTPSGSQTNVKEVTDVEATASEIIAGVDR
ncbi:pentapeptide repeat-containing protein [Halobaculum sp. MBLA0147]|uniref:pentapeptide repeat-containing protein n=1 Tax=Halobaculum sp. MBLA0147 TaxID=3079934 RepID=UPI003523257E